MFIKYLSILNIEVFLLSVLYKLYILKTGALPGQDFASRNTYILTFAAEEL